MRCSSHMQHTLVAASRNWGCSGRPFWMLKIVSHCNILSWLLDCYFIKTLYTKLCSVVFRTSALYVRVISSSLNLLLFVLTLVVHIFLAHLHKCSDSTVNSQQALSLTSLLIPSLMILYRITQQLISSSQALQFIVDLGFHYSLPPSPMVSGHCMSAFLFPCKVLFYLISPSFP